jgi:UDP-N-acetylmuramate--alanine ligase
VNLDKTNNIYLLGIGGIGMSALARYFKNAGKNVAGYDKTPTPLTSELLEEGIDVNFIDQEGQIGEIFKNIEGTLVIYTPAIPKESRQLNYFLNNGFAIEKRAKVLGSIAESNYTIAVAGTHGKTTTSTLAAHILKSSGEECAAFLGGISMNYSTNLLLPSKNKSSKMVVEADEYDRSFLTLFPDIAIVTSMDADHLDIYENKNYLEESFCLFASQIRKEGYLIAKAGLNITASPEVKKYTYSSSGTADFYSENIRIEKGSFVFDFKSPLGNIDNITFNIPGRHNIENAVAASATAQLIGLGREKIKAALENFKGVKRRFEYVVRQEDKVMIDDYAHHPAELTACISAVKELYQDKKITGVFQPHLYSRTRDFANEFAESLDLLDECILLDIYPARELPIEGVSSEMLLGKMKSTNKKLLKKNELPQWVEQRKPEVLLILGAGDIDQLIEPLKHAFLN